MALVNKIRERSALAIAVIAFGLILFLVGGDLLGPSSVLLGKNQNKVGEIDGLDIDIQEFSKVVEEFKQEYQILYNHKFGESEMPYVRNESWDRMVERIAFKSQYDKLGIVVTDEERTDMFQGNNILPEIAKSFTDPKTGEVDRNQIVKFLQNLSQYPPEQQLRYYLIEGTLAPKRQRVKLEGMMAYSTFVTTAEAEQRYLEQQTKCDVKYLYVPFATMPDSAVTLDANELSAFYAANKNKYDQDGSISMEYVVFEIKPSKEDSMLVFKNLEALKSGFETTDKDTAFVNMYSNLPNNLFQYSLSEMPTKLQAADIKEGNVIGPVDDGGYYKLYKILSTADDSVYTMRASHILFAANESDAAEKKAEAKSKAQEILKQIKDGANFEEMAAQYGSDATKSKGGDLGWFKEGAMVKPFEQAVMSMTTEGLVPTLVETQFGYHIVKVTGAKNKSKVNVGVIAKSILPLEETRNQVYQEAGSFSQLKSYDDFKEAVDKEGGKIIRFDALEVKENAQNINNLQGGDSRKLIRWAFNDAEIGNISDVMEFEDKYVVAALKERIEPGIPPLEKISEKVIADAKKDKKGKMITEKLSALKGSLEEIQKGYGTEARVIPMQSLTLNGFSLAGVGSSPVAIGRAFALNEGERTGPFADDNGVLILEVTKVEKAADIADYTSYKQQVINDRSENVAQNVMKAIKKLTNTEENISKYY